MTINSTVLDTYADFFLARYNNYPQGRYMTVVIARHIESEAIFRTEGSGEPLNKEFTFGGKKDDSPIQRVVISKRKQTAVERRTGRELLRTFNLLKKTKEGDVCALNRNAPCEKCMDCMIYGYAAGGGGAQRSRVVTDDAFSLHSANVVTSTKQFNALFDNSTMRDPETGEPSTSIGTDEYVMPGSVFLDMETFRDLTREEFIYVFGNVLRSSRYGAISSRIGKVQNHVASVILSDCEVFSNLELTQQVYDALRDGPTGEVPFPMRVEAVISKAQSLVGPLCKEIPSRITILSVDEVETLSNEITTIYQDEDLIKFVLETASAMYGK